VFYKFSHFETLKTDMFFQDKTIHILFIQINHRIQCPFITFVRYKSFREPFAMNRIKIKNFGPIKEGFGKEWIDIKKLTVFIGNQGSGKSTIAKLISTFTWIEKALIRGDIEQHISNEDFIEFIRYHRMEYYIEPNSEIEYEGESYSLKLIKNIGAVLPHIEARKLTNPSKPILLPKIMYVPAERNFLSAIENVNKISNLIGGSLRTYSIEYRSAQIKNSGQELNLPINKTQIQYEQKDDEIYLKLGDKKIKLADASSGFHSVVPLFLVSKYLVDFVNLPDKEKLETLSLDQIVRRHGELINWDISEYDTIKQKEHEEKINAKYICKYLVNIVEEPEQNLFPTSQWEMLKKLLEFNNINDDNKLILTTHSPYILNYISIAIQAGYLYTKIKGNKNSLELIEKLENIISLKSLLAAADVVIYQLDETNGTINKLPNSEGIPSDNNFLNQSLHHGNEMFDNLLEIEQEL
jgi:predicted ATPase